RLVRALQRAEPGTCRRARDGVQAADRGGCAGHSGRAAGRPVPWPHLCRHQFVADAGERGEPPAHARLGRARPREFARRSVVRACTLGARAEWIRRCARRGARAPRTISRAQRDADRTRRLARAGEDADGDLGAQLDELASDASAAVEELRELAHGIYPTVLRERGVAAALEAFAEAVPIPIRIDDHGVERAASGVEVAIYYC